MYCDNDSLLLPHGFDAVFMRCASLAANKAKPRDKTETGWTIRRTTDEGFLSAGRIRGAG